MGKLALDGKAELVSRDQILRRERGQGNIHFPCSANHEQDWQPYPVDPYFAISDDHTFCTKFGMGTIKAHTNWSMVTPEKAATLTELIFNIFFRKVSAREFQRTWALMVEIAER